MGYNVKPKTKSQTKLLLFGIVAAFILGNLDSRTRTRTSSRFDCLFLPRIIYNPDDCNLFVSSIGCSFILIAGN